MSLLCCYMLEYSNLCQGSKAVGMKRKISIFTNDAKSDTKCSSVGEADEMVVK